MPATAALPETAAEFLPRLCLDGTGRIWLYTRTNASMSMSITYCN